MASVNSVDFGLAFAILVQAGGIIWWAATASNDIKALKAENSSLKSSNAALAGECKALAEKINEHGNMAARLDERSQAVLDLIKAQN